MSRICLQSCINIDQVLMVIGIPPPILTRWHDEVRNIDKNPCVIYLVTFLSEQGQLVSSWLTYFILFEWSVQTSVGTNRKISGCVFIFNYCVTSWRIDDWSRHNSTILIFLENWRWVDSSGFIKYFPFYDPFHCFTNLYSYDITRKYQIVTHIFQLL